MIYIVVEHVDYSPGDILFASLDRGKAEAFSQRRAHTEVYEIQLDTEVEFIV